MHTSPGNTLIKDILFSYGSYYISLVRVLVCLSEAVTKICWKKLFLISMKKTFKRYLLKGFIFSKVTDCRHATWLKKPSSQVSSTAWLVLLLTVSWSFSNSLIYSILLAPSATSLELFQNLWKCIMIQYPKKLSKKIHIPKNLCAGWKIKSKIFPTSLPYLKKVFLRY